MARTAFVLTSDSIGWTIVVMAAELPRCAVCRVAVKPAENVVFRNHGRVQHVTCPEIVCPVCSRPVAPHDPIRRDGETLLHGNCWMRRARSVERQDARPQERPKVTG